MPNPKVSVCIPTYNYARFLPEAIESVLTQSYADFELIVIDDNSSDDTKSVMDHFVKRDARIKFSVNPQNLGLVANWNRCLAVARGKYIKFVFGDDLLLSNTALQQMVALMESDSSISLVASARQILDTSSNIIKKESRFRKSTTLTGVEVVRCCLLEQKNLIGEPSAVMFRKSDATRGFDGRYRHLVDLEMWFHLLERGKFGYINNPLCAFRRHSAQQTVKNNQSNVTLNDTELLLSDYLQKPYIIFGTLARSFIIYDFCFQVWRTYRRKKLSRGDAMAKIRESFDVVTFVLLLPVYRISKSVLKIVRTLFHLASP